MIENKKKTKFEFKNLSSNFSFKIEIYCVPCMEGNEGKRKTDVRV